MKIHTLLIGIGIWMSLLMSCGSSKESSDQAVSTTDMSQTQSLSADPHFNLEENSWEFMPASEAYFGGQLYVPDSVLADGELLLETHDPSLVFRLPLANLIEKADQWQDVALDWNLYAGRCYVLSSDRDTLTLLPQDYVNVGISRIRLTTGVQSRIDTLSWKHEAVLPRKRLLVVSASPTRLTEQSFVHVLPDQLYNLGLFTHVGLIEPAMSDQLLFLEKIKAFRPDVVMWVAPSGCSGLSKELQEMFCTGNSTSELLIQQMQSSKRSVILCTPNAVSPRLASQSSVQTAEQLAQDIRSLANRYSLPIIDVWSSFDTYEGEAGYEMEELLQADGIHPNSAGHRRIARDVAATLEYVYLYE